MAKVSRFLLSYSNFIKNFLVKRRNAKVLTFGYSCTILAAVLSKMIIPINFQFSKLIKEDLLMINKCFTTSNAGFKVPLLCLIRKLFALLGNNSVNLLNFVHAFEDFNRRFFVKAELEPTEMEIFHREMSRIMDDFFAPSSKSALPIKGNR